MKTFITAAFLALSTAVFGQNVNPPLSLTVNGPGTLSSVIAGQSSFSAAHNVGISLNIMTTSSVGSPGVYYRNSSFSASTAIVMETAGDLAIYTKTFSGTFTTPTLTLDDATRNATFSSSLTVSGTLTTPTASLGTTSVSSLRVGSTGSAITIFRRATTQSMTSGVATFSDAAITANSIIVPYSLTPAGTPGALFLSGKSAGASYSISSTSGSDTATVGALIYEP